MTNPDGSPIWYELMTTDADAAQAFYEVLGWTIAPFGGAATGDYRILTAPDGAGVGGLMTLPDGAPMKPGWFGYIGVADVDAAAAKAKTLGGDVLIPPTDISGVGRFAFLADPQGLTFYVMRGDSPDGSTAFDPTAPGHIGWNELVSSDLPAALAFYGEMFGWENKETSKTPMGDYCYIDHAGVRIGAMTTAGNGFAPRWSYYINVESVDAAKARIETAGGTIAFGPYQVPNDRHILLAIDPQGASFTLVGGI